MSRRRCSPFALAVFPAVFPAAFAAVFGLASAAALPSALAAQKPAEPPPVEPRAPRGTIAVGKDGFVLPMGEVSAEELIDGAARYLGRNILWQPQDLARVGSFVFQRPLATDALGCEEVLYGLLASRGVAVVPVDEELKVYEVLAFLPNQQGMQVRPELAARAVLRTPQEVLRRPRLREYLTTNFRLSHVRAEAAAQALNQFLNRQGTQVPFALNIGLAPNINAVLLQGFGDQVALALRLLDALDVAVEPRDPQGPDLAKQLDVVNQRLAALATQLAALQSRIDAVEKGAPPPRAADPAKSGG